MRLKLVSPPVLASLLISVALSGPAAAASHTWSDKSGETAHGAMDIGQVKVSNDKAGVVVDFRIPEASEGVYPYGTFRVSLDTSTKHAGAEYTWAGGLPGDSGFSKYNGDARWRWEGSCYKSTREYLDLDGGVFRVRFVPKVGCLYKPKRVRVYVKTVSAGLWDNVGGVFTQWPDEGDFFEQKGVYSPWVGYS